MNEWVDELSDLCAADEPAVLVTVAGIRGSAPREGGAKMIVTATETIGTIGGGQLEYQCTHLAAGMLDADRMTLRSFPLGAAMGQPAVRISSWATGWSGILKPTVGRPEVTMSGTWLAFSRTRVRGPGQKASARRAIRGSLSGVSP